MMIILLNVICATLFIGCGALLIKHSSLLKVLNFPPALLGGIAGLICLSLCSYLTGIKLPSANEFRDLLLILFFISVGLSIKPQQWRTHKKEVISLGGATALLIIIQNIAAILIAKGLGLSTFMGLIGGSVTFVGGLGSAIAWGKVLELEGVMGATEAGIIAATIGLVAGALIAGPYTLYLIKRHKISASPLIAKEYQEEASHVAQKSHPLSWLTAMLVILSCFAGGELIQYFTSGLLTIPRFLSAMIVAVVVTMITHACNKKLPSVQAESIGVISLNLFITMTLYGLELSVLSNLATPLLLMALAQIIITCSCAYFFVFRKQGKDYDAAVMAGAYIGYGLSSFSIAMATIRQVNSNHGPSPRAYQSISFVGAAVVDIINAVMIALFIMVIKS